MDYGPFGFLDTFQIDHICNHSDHGGRYAYHRQAEVLHWNLYCLVSAMLEALQEELHSALGLDQEASIEKIKDTLDHYNREYANHWQSLFRKKLGLSIQYQEDVALLEELLQELHHNQLDYTLFFRHLSEGQDVPKSLETWNKKYQERLSLEKHSKDQRLEQMCRNNPKYVLRNHLAQNAIELAQKKDFSEVTRLLKILENPYESQAVSEDYAMGPPPELAHVAISCSS